MKVVPWITESKSLILPIHTYQMTAFWKAVDVYDILRILQEYGSIHELLSTTKYFAGARRCVLYWRMNRAVSIKYLYDPLFRTAVHGIVENSRNQLSLVFDSCAMTDVSALSNVHSLILYKCKYLVDVSPLRNVHVLMLGYCNKVVDVSALKNVHSLVLCHCKRITDVSVLTNVHVLRIYFDSKISAAKALLKKNDEGNLEAFRLFRSKEHTNIPQYIATRRRGT